MNQKNESPLLQPYTLGSLQLRNRVVMAPMTRVRADEAGLLPDYAVDYYRQRASAGLIISEATNISPQAKGALGTPGIWTDAQVASWARITAAVHAEGGLMFLQLWHTGRLSHNDVQPNGAAPIAPSAIQPTGKAYTPSGLKDYPVPRALDTDEIPSIVADYKRAAERAKDAGFDGVEIHSANNYLIEQFIRDSTNHRDDEYGGSIENRLRFPLAVAQAVSAVWGSDRVGIRISPTSDNGGPATDSNMLATYGAYVDALSKLGLAYIHAVEGTTFVARKNEYAVDYDMLRHRFRHTYIANNAFGQTDAEQTLTANHADLISFGRLFITNPDLVERFRRGGPFAEAPKEYWYGGGRLGYSDWPALI